MKLIRRNTFETNSSSTHSITIPNDVDISNVHYHNIRFCLGEFGWGWGKYDLIDYIWTAICEIKRDNIEYYKDKIINILSPYVDVIEFEEPIIDCYGLDNGYIDHSWELEDFIDDIFSDEELFVRAIFDGYVRTGNDNEDGTIEDDNSSNDNYYHYYKDN